MSDKSAAHCENVWLEFTSAQSQTGARRPPHNLEAEQALLGAILVDNRALERVEGFLEAWHFYDPLHSEIFIAICSAIAARKLASPITLRVQFEDWPPISETLSVPQYLGTLAANATTIINAGDYGRLVHDLARLRSLILIGEDLVNGAYDAKLGTSPIEHIEEAERRLFEIAEKGRNVRDEISFADASLAAVKAANTARMSDGNIRGLSTGFADLDAKLGGMQKSDLIIIAGRPSMGKTALATNIAWNIARRGSTVDFRSLEMSAEQLATRVLSFVAGVASEKFRCGSEEREMRALIEAQQAVQDTPLLIDESGGLSIAQLAARARRTKRKHGTELIVIDYLQLMAGGKRSRDNRVQELTEITNGLKALAKELQVPIIALSQLNRAVEARTEKRPQLADLRESGSIEQDADIVLFVYREEYYVERTQPGPADHVQHAEWQQAMQRVAGKAEVIIGKHRHGPTGIVPMAFNGLLTRFDDLARGGGGDG